MKKQAGNFATAIALIISLGWGALLAHLILRDQRPNVWYDMDLSVWILSFFYAFIHIFIGNLWSMLITNVFFSSLDRIYKPQKRWATWSEDIKILFASFWPISGPLAVLTSTIAIQYGKRSQ
ncbi:MAG: hypothetical protein MUO76_13815 [Anaerolineaceae bacterium]|nr:hypothetical protein [Anaerolineaceae bacterium]